MAQHYTRDTEQAQIFCRKCMAITTWRILGGKAAYCIPCYQKSAAKSEAEKSAPPKPEQGDLF
jgi:hypothetical protein